MKRFFSLVMFLGLMFWSLTAKAQPTMAQYISRPISMSSAIKPNVVLLLDNSGSMTINAYDDPGKANWDSDYVQNNFNISGSYYGYFDSGKRYSYFEMGGFFMENGLGDWNGKFLNWATMRRVDLARKVLVGGKVGITERGNPGPWYLLGQNEPAADFTFTKYVDADGLTPSKANTLLTVKNGKAHLSRFSTQIASGEYLEVGRIKVDFSWQTVTFNSGFSAAPVLVAKPVRLMCSASALRIDNLDENGFDIMLEEFKPGTCDVDTNYSDFGYSLVTFMAVTAGSHTINDLELEAGTVSAINETSTTVTFTSSFSSTPIVISSVDSTNDDTDLVVTRNKNVTTGGFDVFMQEGEVEDGTHSQETIGWVAISQSPVSGAVADQTFEVGTSWTDDSTGEAINFTPPFESAPFLLADMQTFYGGNPANLILNSIDSKSASIRVLEEKTYDAETGHSFEMIGYIAISMPSYNIRVQVLEEPSGVVQEIEDKVRLGLAVYNYDHSLTGDAKYNWNFANGGTLWPTWEWEDMGACDAADQVIVNGNLYCKTPTHVKAPIDNIIRAIEEYPQIWGTTPTAETLYEIGRYFQQDNPYFTQSGKSGIGNESNLGDIYGVNDAWDPYYYSTEFPEPEIPYCAKSFVIIISDGAPWRDFTDGGRTSSLDTEIDDAINGLSVGPEISGSQNDFVDDVAWYLHTNDLRTGGKNIDGKQTISVYTVLAAFGKDDSGGPAWAEESMKDAAVNGGFEDWDGDNKPDITHKDVKDQGGWGSWGGTSEEWDNDDNKYPDHYYLATDGAELKVQLVKTIGDILKQVSSGTAASVLSTLGEAKGVVFQAYYKPSEEYKDTLIDIKADWVGYLQGLWIDPWGNLREDTNQNQGLDLKDVGDGTDKIIQFVFNEDTNEVDIYFYNDNGTADDPDGVRDTCKKAGCYPGKDGCKGAIGEEDYCEADGSGSMDDIEPLWEAGKKLAQRVASDRNIKTWVDLNNNGDVDPGEFIDFDTTNASILRPFLGAVDDTEAANIIKFIRGEDVTGYRSRDVYVDGVVQVWKLGDIVNSTPTVVGRPAERMHEYYSDEDYGDFFNKWTDNKRNITVYAGANDGMLHAFNGGKFENDFFAGGGAGGCLSDPSLDLGAERWAYIPQSLLPHLKWLTQTDYSCDSFACAHVNYVDFKPRVTDARIFVGDQDGVGEKHAGGWGTILVGGVGFGGGEITLTDNFGGPMGSETRTFRPSYFCLDITDPDPDSSDPPKLLWEFTHYELGFTTSYPGFIRVADDDVPSTEGNWYTVFGSGPTKNDGTSDQSARFFVLDLKTGVIKTDNYISNQPNGFMASPITIDYQLDYSDDMIYIGETYDVGAPGSAGNGMMHRISTRNSYVDGGDWPYEYFNPSMWTVTTLSDGFNGGPLLPPVTSSAMATLDKADNLWVYFGTGKLFDDADKADVSEQYFLGVIDSYNKDGGAKNNLDFGSSGSDVSDFEIGTDGTVYEDGLTASAKDFNEYIDDYKLKGGWYVELGFGNNPGERLLTKPSILGGTLLFTTFKPSGDVCGYGGDSYLYALYYETGTAYTKSIIGKGNDYNLKSKKLDKGMAADVGIYMSSAGRSSKGRTLIQQSSGVIEQAEIVPALDVIPGIYAWFQ